MPSISSGKFASNSNSLIFIFRLILLYIIQTMNPVTPASANETNAIKPIGSIGKKLTILPELHLILFLIKSNFINVLQLTQNECRFWDTNSFCRNSQYHKCSLTILIIITFWRIKLRFLDPLAKFAKLFCQHPLSTYA
jgi:hypothetical protein